MPNLTYHKLTTELRYRNMSVNELTNIIGNELTMKAYNDIPGKLSKDKADWLKKYFEALKTSSIRDGIAKNCSFCVKID